MLRPLATLDVEAFSLAGYYWDDARQRWIGPPGAAAGKKGLPVVGAAVYWEHPTADVLTLSYMLPGQAVKRWAPGQPPPADLCEWLRADGPVEFHNAMFERLGFHHVLTPRYGFLALNPAQIHCSMATARVNAYPGGLDDLGKALRTDVRKDPEGKRLMALFSMPRNPTKADSRRRILPADKPEEFERYQAYCDTDVLTEHDASSRMPAMTAAERASWLHDQQINWRGMGIDRPAVRDSIAVLEQALELYGAECREITGGIGPNQTTALPAWISGRGVTGIYSVDSDAVAAALARDDLPDDVRRVLELRALVGSSSVKKLYAMENMATRDDRLKNLFVHHGTGPGRPSGSGPQPLNLPKAGPKLITCSACERPFTLKRMTCPWCGSLRGPAQDARWKPWMADHVLAVMGMRSLPMLERYFGDALLCISGCIRGMFTAAPGHELIASDYSAIQAVVAACLAGEQWRIDTFRSRTDIYLAGASKITGTSVQAYLDYYEAHGEHHGDRQRIGKVSELACGFGGWIKSYQAFGSTDPDETIKQQILAWRAASPAIVEMWGGQQRNWKPELYGLEGCAVRAIQTPGTPHGYRGIWFYVENDVLYMTLLSGRRISYPEPRLSPSTHREGTLEISYMRDNRNPANGQIGFHRNRTWGSRFFENCLAAGTLVLTDSGWKPIETITPDDLVHDGIELVNQKGNVYKSEQRCIVLDGVWLTPDHEVLNDDGWRAASETDRPYRPEIWNVEGYRSPPEEAGVRDEMAVRMRLREGLRTIGTGGSKRPVSELWLSHAGTLARKGREAWHVRPPRLRGLAGYAGSLSATVASGVAQLWGAWHFGLRTVVNRLRSVLGRHGAYVRDWIGTRPEGQQCRLFTGELSLDSSPSELQQPTSKRLVGHAERSFDDGAGRARIRAQQGDSSLADKPRMAERTAIHPVYDILDCGPRHRFVVLGRGGPFIVHNCVMGVEVDIVRYAKQRLENAGYPIVYDCYDELMAEVPAGFGSIEEFERIGGEMPGFAADWPIRMNGGFRAVRYRKG